jgi:adenosylcobyric acid synthase
MAAIVAGTQGGAMKQAKVLMIQGTASSVGKSTLVTGLCRLFAQEGLRVAPFKAQNMALNSWVTRDGGEMGRAQVVQAEAAGIEPIVEMNPVLLKPEGHARSQVIVLGRPLGAMEAHAYYRHRTTMQPVIQQALTTLLQRHDLVIIEGAGSPVELNLATNDLVNMHIARLVHAPVLLVGDIDRGGIFAALLGTLLLLSPEDRALVKGLIVNKFRGDIALWRDGETILAQRAALPVLGTVPYFHDIRIAEEDSVALDDGTASILHASTSLETPLLEIVIVRLPYLVNYDEFDALAADPRVRLRFVSSPDEFPDSPDLIILPGTKNTLADLAWLWQRGLAMHLRQCVRRGCAVLGICGGYQMLGERICDPAGFEAGAGTIEPGLSLLPVETTFVAPSEKITLRCQVQIAPSATRGLFARIQGQDLQAYQIHLGRTTTVASGDSLAGTWAFETDTNGPDGWLSATGWCAGCYLHGLFENDQFRQSIIATLLVRRCAPVTDTSSITFDRQQEYDKLAQLLRQHLDIQQLKSLCGLD